MQNDSIKYDPDVMSDAIVSAKKIDDNIDSINAAISSVNSSIPSGFSSSTLSNTISSLNKINDKLINVSSVLTEIQNSLEDVTNSGIFSELIKSEYTQLITLDSGQSGYLYKPPGDNLVTGLPLVVCLAGAGHCTNSNLVKNWGLPSLIENGYNLNAVVWVPLSTNAKWTLDIAKKDTNNKYYNKILNLTGSEDKVSNTMVSCEELVDKLKLDRNRISILGHSSGSYAAFKYTHDLPHYFSTAVTYGCGGENYEGKETKEQMQAQAESGTTYIILNGTKDDNTHQGAADELYNYLNSNGGQAMMYKIYGATHNSAFAGYILNSGLINDILNIKKDEKLNTKINDVKYITCDEMLKSSISRIGNSINESNWYVQLSKNNNLDNYVPLVSSTENINSNSGEKLSDTYKTDLSVYHNNPGFEVTTGNIKYNLTKDEILKMAAVVTAEMGGNYSYDDGLAVASVILNRCENENWINHYGTSPIDQISHKSQFAVYGGNSYNAYYNNNSYKNNTLTEAQQKKFDVGLKATIDALNGVRNNLDYTEFRAPGFEGWSGYQSASGGNVFNTSKYDNRVLGGKPVSVDLDSDAKLEVKDGTNLRDDVNIIEESKLSEPDNNISNEEASKIIDTATDKIKSSVKKAIDDIPFKKDDNSAKNVEVGIKQETPSFRSVSIETQKIPTILPKNEYSSYFPSINVGTVVSLDMNDSHVAYEIYFMTNEAYNKFIEDLLNDGYKLVEEGKYMKDNLLMSLSLNGDEMYLRLDITK